jgi:small subunit ribosomal protein S18
LSDETQKESQTQQAPTEAKEPKPQEAAGGPEAAPASAPAPAEARPAGSRPPEGRPQVGRPPEGRPREGRPGEGRGGEGRGPREGGREGGKRGRRGFFRKKKVCRFCVDRVDYIDYKKPEQLMTFIQERGKIMPRRITGTCSRHQRWLAEAIKRARNIALMPFGGAR